MGYAVICSSHAVLYIRFIRFTLTPRVKLGSNLRLNLVFIFVIFKLCMVLVIQMEKLFYEVDEDVRGKNVCRRHAERGLGELVC